MQSPHHAADILSEQYFHNVSSSPPQQDTKVNGPDLVAGRRPSLKHIFAPLSQRAPKVTTPSTNKIILDYLLYLSIQSRLTQAHVRLLELSTPLPDSNNTESIEVLKKRWMETAMKAEQDKNAVESIVAGILSAGSKIKTPSFQVDGEFEHRLHLCQLTNLVFGRFDAASAGQHVIAQKSTRRRRHEAQVMATVIEADPVKKENNDGAGEYMLRHQLFSKPILPRYCRRHRIQSCHTCRSPFLMSNANKTPDQMTESQEDNSCSGATSPTPSSASVLQPPPPGLIEAIPMFMKTSADMLRRTLETGDQGEASPMIFAGQKVMGGGMPPRWYDLFLELLTQAAIESYLCDAQTGLESIFEIFSYGDVEDEDEPDDHDDENDNEGEDDDDDAAEVCDDGNDNDQDQDKDHDNAQEEDSEEDNDWGVRAADHHLLFPKTRTMYLFKTQVREREKEFLFVKGQDLKQHFEQLAKRYPLEAFEQSMGEFIQMILSTMDTPALDKYEKGDHITSPETSPLLKSSAAAAAAALSATSLPPVYKYPGDGSLLMPEIPDIDEDEKTADTSDSANKTASGAKRRLSLSEVAETKRSKP